MRQKSQEWYIGTSEGVIKVRDVKEMEIEKERWVAKEIKELKGLPWEPIPGKGKRDIGAKILIEEIEEKPDKMEEVEDRVMLRRVRITKEDVNKYGPTKGCKGCREVLKGGTWVHSEDCRKRMEGLMWEQGDKRVERAMDRYLEGEEVKRTREDGDNKEDQRVRFDEGREEDATMVDDDGDDMMGEGGMTPDKTDPGYKFGGHGMEDEGLRDKGMKRKAEDEGDNDRIKLDRESEGGDQVMLVRGDREDWAKLNGLIRRVKREFG